MFLILLHKITSQLNLSDLKICGFLNSAVYIMYITVYTIFIIEVQIDK